MRWSKWLVTVLYCYSYQDLHWDIHSVCLWDNEDGPQKVHNALKSDIVNFVKVAQEVYFYVFVLYIFK